MRNFSMILLAFSSLAVFVASCGGEEKDQRAEPAVSSGSEANEGQAQDQGAQEEIPSYSLTIQPILAKKCTPCHQSGGSNSNQFVWSDYSNGKTGAKEKAERIRIRTGNDTMPLTSDKLTAEEKALVKAWIDGGLKE